MITDMYVHLISKLTVEQLKNKLERIAAMLENVTHCKGTSNVQYMRQVTSLLDEAFIICKGG